MAKKRIKHVQTFTGGVKTVFARELVPHNVSIKMHNCHVMVTAEGDVGVVRNPKGNTQISFSLPEGQNQCIGYAKNLENSVAFLFYWNSNKFHSIRKFNSVTKEVTTVVLNLIDTGNIDILKFAVNHLILHAEVTRRDLLYWCDGLNNARKTNLNKLEDKSDSGYGTIIKQEFIDAYKRTSAYAPTVEYFSDTTVPFNKVYGTLIKASQRYRYDDYEKSVCSDFSAVALPDKEPSNGINSIPTNNNGINITVNTGDRLVKLIDIIVQFSSDPSTWFVVATIDKKKLELSDYSDYVYPFYNDLGNYPALDPNEIDQNQIYMPKRPLCQALAKRAITYTNGYQGFESITIDASVSVSYADLFIEDGEEDKLNSPVFSYSSPTGEVDYVSSDPATRYDGVVETIPSYYRFIRHTLTVGIDVKKGNEFVFGMGNGTPQDQFTFTVKATLSDTAATIANKIKGKLIETGRIYRKTPQLVDSNIYSNTVDGDGNITFSYIVRASLKKGYMEGYASVQPVSYKVLKDTGESIKNYKMGSTIKLGIEYEDDPDQRKSLTYTSDALIVGIQPVNIDGMKATTIRLQINHRPPKWAKYYNIVRTEDLRYSDFTQVLIQNVVQVPTQNTDNYLDLVIGSFFTYKKLHPNSTLTYAFEGGDRISLRKKTSDGSYYSFFETEVLSFNEIVSDKVRDSIKINGTTTVEVSLSSVDNIGKFIVIDNAEREIIGRPSATTYILNNPIGELADKKYNYYELVDRRGVLRIRKPAAPVVIEEGSIIEVYKPAKVLNTDKVFKEFQQKYPIINPGTDNAYHGGNPQNQDASNPALIDLSEGTVYVRNREMPINNAFPDTQVIVELVEDASVSDFYISNFNDNGRINYEDNGRGEVHLDSTTWFSNNAIENTEINGLGFFQNTNREDHNDEYGATMLTKFLWNRIFIFKKFTDAYLPVDARMTQDLLDTTLLVASTNFLNPIQYLTSGLGIGNNPESYAANQNQQYYISPNTGKAVRLGGNGAEPISETFDLDNFVFDMVKDVAKNNGKIFGEFDEVINNYIFTIPSYNKKIFLDGFRDFSLSVPVPEGTIYEIVTYPLHGNIVFTSPTQWTYSGYTDYVGPDSFSYRAFVNGSWTEPENICLDVVENLNRQKRWRPINPFCVVQEGEFQTGYQGFTNLEQYYLDSNLATGIVKVNIDTDPDYIAPIVNEDTCTPDFSNVLLVQDFTTECTDGFGSVVPYTVPAKKYYRGSQVDADARAQADADEFGQPNANANGTCTPEIVYTAVVKSGTAQKSGCTLPAVGSYVTLYSTSAPTPPAPFTSIVSQGIADALAQAWVDANKQANADSLGSCVTPPGSFGNDAMSETFWKEGCTFPLVGSPTTYSIIAGAFTAATKALANAAAVADITANGQTTANGAGSCVSGSKFTLEIIIYSNYRNAILDSLNTHGRNFTFSAGGVPKGMLKLGASVGRDDITHTYSVPFVGSSFAFSLVKVYLTLNATSVSGSFLETLFINGAFAGDNHSSMASGKASGTEYELLLAPAGSPVIVNGSTLRIEFGNPPTITYYSAPYGEYATPSCTLPEVSTGDVYYFLGYGAITSTVNQITADNLAIAAVVAGKQAYADANGCAVPPSCDLSIAFSSKTNESAPGANDGSITITGYTSYGGGFVLSKDNGAAFPYSGTSPYTFNGLAPGTYTIKARNADGTCTTAISPVTINASITYYSRGTAYGGSGPSIACDLMSGGFTLYTTVSGSLHTGDEIFYLSGGIYIPYTGSTYLSWTESGTRVVSEIGGGQLQEDPHSCPSYYVVVASGSYSSAYLGSIPDNASCAISFGTDPVLGVGSIYTINVGGIITVGDTLYYYNGSTFVSFAGIDEGTVSYMQGGTRVFINYEGSGGTVTYKGNC
jgi:hypothetical protein